MNNLLKEEQDKLNNESDYILFHLKNNKLYFEKTAQKASKEIINNSKNNFTNSSSMNDINIKQNKEENIKIPFNNLILRQKINSSNFKTLISTIQSKINLKKQKIEYNKNNSNNNEFLTINKLENFNQIKNNVNNENDINNKIIYKITKRNFHINSSKTFNNKKIKNDIKIKVHKISTGQQTMYRNFIKNNNKYNNNNYIHNYNRKNYQVKNIIIRNKLIKNKYPEKFNININNEINNYVGNSDLFESISANDINYGSFNESNHKLNYNHKLIKNNSDLINYNNSQKDKSKNFISMKEIYNKMKSKQDKNKKLIYHLKNKKIVSYLKNKNKMKKNNYEGFNSNLMSLEHYILEKNIKKNHLMKKMKIKFNKEKKIKKEKSCFFHRYKLPLKDFKDSNYEFKEDIFTNILKSISCDNNNSEERFNSKINKNSHINILTMLELNNITKNKKEKK